MDIIRSMTLKAIKFGLMMMDTKYSMIQMVIWLGMTKLEMLLS